MTKQIQYTLLREFGEDLIRDIQVSDAVWEQVYFHYITGYALGLIHALKLDKSEASNIRSEAKELMARAADECKRVKYVQKYNEAMEYCKNRLKKTDGVNKVLRSASSDEIISLYETGWSSRDTCDFMMNTKSLKRSI